MKIESLRTFRAAAPFYLIAGPCVIQDEKGCLEIAAHIKALCDKLGLPAIFKASFDKANRTSSKGYRGVGISQGLEILEKASNQTGLPVLTDIHHPVQAEAAARVCSILQIPAFLCRQTDLVEAAAKASKIVAVKKGQFLSPWDTSNIVKKVKAASPETEVILTERGTTFGYGNLVVDMRSFPVMSQWADSVVFDVTHSLQLPGAGGEKTLGQREFIPALARAAIATGSVDGLFLEVHPNPSESPSDSENMLPLQELEQLLSSLIKIARAASLGGTSHT